MGGEAGPIIEAKSSIEKKEPSCCDQKVAFKTSGRLRSLPIRIDNSHQWQFCYGCSKPFTVFLPQGNKVVLYNYYI